MGRLTLSFTPSRNRMVRERGYQALKVAVRTQTAGGRILLVNQAVAEGKCIWGHFWQILRRGLLIHYQSGSSLLNEQGIEH